MSNIPKKKNKPINIIPSDDDFLRIFLPMIDDEEQRRLEELDKEEDDWHFSLYDDADEDEEINN